MTGLGVCLHLPVLDPPPAFPGQADPDQPSPSPDAAMATARKPPTHDSAGQGVVTMSAMLVKVFSRMRPCTLFGNLIHRKPTPAM